MLRAAPAARAAARASKVPLTRTLSTERCAERTSDARHPRSHTELRRHARTRPISGRTTSVLARARDVPREPAVLPHVRGARRALQLCAHVHAPRERGRGCG
jgi:hypothetical protein